MATKPTEANSNLPSARVLGRVDNWWYSKVAPAIAVSWCASLFYHVPVWDTARSILLIAFVGLCAGSYGHIINDVYDIEVDRNAGKRNHMARFTPFQQFLFCAGTLALGFAPALFVSYTSTSLLLLAVEFLLPTIYSIPPIRLKGRGALGLVCDSFGAHMVPCFYCISVLAHFTTNPALLHSPTSVIFIALTGVWALAVGIIGILIHEFEDRENDIRSGIRTFATEIEFSKVRGSIAVFYAIELIAFAGIVVVLFPVAPAIACALALFIVVVAIKLSSHWPHYRQYQRDEVAIQWWQLSHPFYEAYLPIAAAMQCAWISPWLGIFPVLQFVVFAPTFRQQASDLEDAFRSATAWLSWGGRLNLAEGSDAWAWPAFGPNASTRVAIRSSGAEQWSIRLCRPGIAVRAGQQYDVKFMIRSNQPRNILFGIWQDHAPWELLGYCESADITSEWRLFERTFTIDRDDSSGYFGIWMGGAPGSLDVSRCSLTQSNQKIR